jgi:hypothetical protein
MRCPPLGRGRILARMHARQIFMPMWASSALHVGARAGLAMGMVAVHHVALARNSFHSSIRSRVRTDTSLADLQRDRVT